MKGGRRWLARGSITIEPAPCPGGGKAAPGARRGPGVGLLDRFDHQAGKGCSRGSEAVARGLAKVVQGVLRGGRVRRADRTLRLDRTRLVARRWPVRSSARSQGRPLGGLRGGQWGGLRVWLPRCSQGRCRSKARLAQPQPSAWITIRPMTGLDRCAQPNPGSVAAGCAVATDRLWPAAAGPSVHAELPLSGGECDRFLADGRCCHDSA